MLLLRFLSLSVALAASQQQPIRYSHKVHVQLGLKCGDCHTMPGKGEAATFPPEAKCMSCHTAVKADSPDIRKIAEFAASRKPIPWVRVYQLPGYVWFSHKRHSKSGCETCHGPVAEREQLVKEKPITMVACMDCHESTGAANECDSCHNP